MNNEIKKLLVFNVFFLLEIEELHMSVSARLKYGDI